MTARRATNRPERNEGRAILVLGMHRSGTSAVAGALAASGIALGDRLIAAAPDNPQGYFENTDAVLTDDQLLHELDRSWDDVRTLPASWLATAAARRAAERIRRDVLVEFGGHALWAVKDPRMCRLLPLWLQALDAAGVEPVGLIVTRHPDEVAASLEKRDGMHARAAHLLWLRHVLESAAAAPAASACVRYEQVLDDPASTLASVAERLGIGLSVEPQRLRTLLTPESRHHRHQHAPATDPWQALSRDAYEAFARPTWRSELADLLARLAALEATDRDWIEAVGMAAREADRRRRRADDEARAAIQRSEVLQAALDTANQIAQQHARDLAAVDRTSRETSEGLARAERLARERSSEAERLAEELRLTQQAKADAEALVAKGVAEVAAIASELQRTQAALTHAEALSAVRLEELSSLTGQLADTQRGLRLAEAAVQAARGEASSVLGQLRATEDALRGAQALVAERTVESAQVADELTRTQEALAAAQAIVVTRGDESVRLAADLKRTQDALSIAQALVGERTSEISGLAAELRRTQEALGTAQALVAERTDESARLAGELHRTQEALSTAELLVTERTDECARLAGELHRTQEALSTAQALVAERTRQATTLADELRRTQDGLSNAEALVAERVSEALTLAAELERTQRALAEAQQVAHEHLQARNEAVARHASELEARVASERRALDLEARVDSLEATLGRIMRSRLWPAFARAAGLPRTKSDG